MNLDALIPAVVFAVAFPALFAAHVVGDIIVQSHQMAADKTLPGGYGRFRCAQHVAELVAVKLLALVAVMIATGLTLQPVPVMLALVVDGVAHYVADRRRPLERFCDWIGKGEFWRLGDPEAAPAGTGRFVIDQAWHIGWLLVAALMIAAGGAR